MLAAKVSVILHMNSARIKKKKGGGMKGLSIFI